MKGTYSFGVQNDLEKAPDCILVKTAFLPPLTDIALPSW